MDLPNIFGAKKPQQQKFLALDIGEEAITAGLWTVEDGKVKLLKSSSSIEWKDENATDAAEAADVALEELGKEADKVDQVVLGLPETWLNEHTIVPERRTLLKTLNEQLALKPLGFVVNTEALTQYLKDLEGGPISAVMVGFTTANLHISVVKAGKVSKSELVGRSGTTTADLTEAFTRLGTKSLPTRILLYSSRMKNEELEIEKQALVAQDWPASGFFLHVPKVETLPQNISISAVCISGGREVAASLGLIARAASADASANVAVGEMGEEEPTVSEPVAEETKEVGKHKAAGEDEFGFTEVAAGAVGAAEVAAVSAAAPTAAEAAEVTNFVVHDGAQSIEHSAVGGDTVQPDTGFPKQNVFTQFTTTVKKTFNSLIAGGSLASKFKVDMAGGKRMRLLLIGIAVVGLATAAGAFFYMQIAMAADVEITLKMLPLTKDIEVAIDPTISETDTTNNILKVHAVQKELTGERDRATTGTTIVGDKAKGKVMIFNATSSTKSFPAGTVLTGPNSLKFTLDSAIEVASSSGSASSLQPGKAEASVTASAIGTDSNLAAKSEFSVANFDKMSYVASNDNAFTGGSSREIQAVSQKDIDTLTEELTTQLKEQAQAELQTETDGNAHVLPAITVTVKDSTSDAEVGDEVKMVKVTMTVVASAYSYEQSDLAPLAMAQLADLVPPGALLREEKTEISVRELTPAEDDESLPMLSATLTTEAIPAIDKAALVQSIQGRTIEQTQSILREKSEVESVEIKIRPTLAKMLFNKLPSQASKISIQTKIQ